MYVLALLNFVSLFFQLAYHNWVIAAFNLVAGVLCTMSALGLLGKGY